MRKRGRRRGPPRSRPRRRLRRVGGMRLTRGARSPALWTSTRSKGAAALLFLHELLPHTCSSMDREEASNDCTQQQILKSGARFENMCTRYGTRIASSIILWCASGEGRHGRMGTSLMTNGLERIRLVADELCSAAERAGRPPAVEGHQVLVTYVSEKVEGGIERSASDEDDEARFLGARRAGAGRRCARGGVVRHSRRTLPPSLRVPLMSVCHASLCSSGR